MANSNSRKPLKGHSSLTILIPWRFVLRLVGLFLRPAVPLLFLLADSAPTGYYSTDIGEQLPLRLRGTLLTLNTNSRISVRDSQGCLGVRVFQGEVLFHVEHGDGNARCLEVWADETLISDIGTTFDVYLTDGRLTVSVIDGAVELARAGAKPSVFDQSSFAITLRQGDRGEVRRGSSASRPTVQRLEMSRILADISWERGELIFDSNSLQDIVQQFNRYNRRPQIEIQDPSIGSLKMTGIFQLHDPQSFLAGLQSVEPRVRVMRTDGPDGDIVLSMRR